jgi:hypothetical protein
VVALTQVITVGLHRRVVNAAGEALTEYQWTHAPYWRLFRRGEPVWFDYYVLRSDSDREYHVGRVKARLWSPSEGEGGPPTILGDPPYDEIRGIPVAVFNGVLRDLDEEGWDVLTTGPGGVTVRRRQDRSSIDG